MPDSSYVRVLVEAGRRTVIKLKGHPAVIVAVGIAAATVHGAAVLAQSAGRSLKRLR